MAIFDNIVNVSDNFKGYTGNPPTNEAEYNALDCWTDKSKAPSWASVSSDMELEEVKHNRREDYPDWGTQLEKIADDGIDAWKTDMLEPVKAKFPKP